MNSLETSIESLTAESTTLNTKLEQIDRQYRVERPLVVPQIGQLAKALSALSRWRSISRSDRSSEMLFFKNYRMRLRMTKTTSSLRDSIMPLHLGESYC